MSKVLEKAIAARTQTTGVRVSMRRTITPAKYTALIAYRITGKDYREKYENVPIL